jgi:tRNA (mo5U34)-methyltransferase
MGIRRLSLGEVDLLISFPKGLGRGIRTLGGLLGTKEPPAEQNAPMPPRAGDSIEAASIRRKVDAIEWYHTIDLGSGILTPGWFDLRPLLHHYPLPERMDGMRVLDVATFDGFWAFEFERRGAAEVVALDIDSFAEVDMNPRVRRTKDAAYLARKTGEGFRLAHGLLNSKVHREVLNVYDLSPERLGHFDLVFVSDVLLHLMNPMKALANVYSVTRGRTIVAEVYDAQLPGTFMRYESGNIHNTWWSIGYGALEQMVHDAGFTSVELKSKFYTGYRGAKPILAHAAFEARP